MRIGYLQTRPRIGQVTENVENALALVQGLEADLVVLPELFNTGYALTEEELGSLAEPPDGPTLGSLRDASREDDLAIVAGFAEVEGERYYNSAALVTPNGTWVHRKVHLFGKEKDIFTPGDGFSVHQFQRARIGMMVCFDWFFPESCRTLMLKGAEIIAHPANLVLPFWPKASVTRAVENHVYIVTAGRVGSERGLRFIGNSLVVSPSGEMLARGSRGRVEHAIVEVEPREARRKSVTSHNDIVGDRRPDAYDLG